MEHVQRDRAAEAIEKIGRYLIHVGAPDDIRDALEMLGVDLAGYMRSDDPIAAIEQWVDAHYEPGQDAEACIREMGPITVNAYEREKLPKSLAKGRAEMALQEFEEHWGEEYGDPEGEQFEEHEKSAALDALTTAFQVLIDATRVWRCEKVAARTYSVDEVIALMRKESPGWFEEDANVDR